ncbi:helix-turn-helix domain-containing protein [Aquimarina sp. 2304DJ70-9]|uniref:helix-turn-helix domain-containing protein n=1 Tax=Aquimarina penaris TaxID=3231044 RepID=UPI003461D09E
MLKPLEGNQETNLNLKVKNSTLSLLLIEKLGFLFILTSGVLPFVHSFVKHEVLEEKIFGFTSVHTFLYSLGVHLSVLFLVIGILMTVSVANDSSKYRVIQRYLQYSLISPFVSAIFYFTWVFIPDVNYNLLAYIFLTLFICAISVIIFYRISKYINLLKSDYKDQLDFIKKTISSIKTNITQNKISDDIIDKILSNLKSFEESKKFVNREINLNHVALELNTNSKYLSKVVNLHKEKTFTQYINDLRIDYFIDQFQKDKKYSNYTIKAIAEEVGFNTANAFSKAFYKKTGKYPSDFIKELEN